MNIILFQRIFKIGKYILANAVEAMEPAKAVKEHKDEIEKLKAKNDEYAKIVGKQQWRIIGCQEKLKSLDSKKTRYC